MFIVPILAILCAPALWVIFGRPRFLPRYEEKTSARISIIIPARNEEDNIRKLLASITQQEQQAYEVLVVNDGSTDNTANIARDNGATVIEAQPLAAGWKGKPWACQQGADYATGEWLLFLDADTCMTSQSFLATLGHLTFSENHVFSICPWHHVKLPYEQLSVFFNLLMVIGMDAFGTDQSSSSDTRLVGQCMFIPKKIYQQCGGHQAVRSEILENYQFSKILRKKGVKRSCYLGKNNLSMRMFPSGFKELWNSWKKGFASGAADVSSKVMVWTSVWITGMITAAISLLVATLLGCPPLFFGIACCAYLTYSVICYFTFRHVGAFSWLNSLFFPISLIFYHVLFFSAVIGAKRGQKVTWKGRDVS